MNLREVKELVNIQKISDDAESNNWEGYFEEDLEIAVVEFEHEVWQAKWDSNLTEEAQDYLDKLQTVIRREILNTIKMLKYKNLEV